MRRLHDRQRARRPAIWLVVIGLLVASSVAATGHHTVKQGETLAGIAARNGVTVNALMQANNIKNPNFILVGDHLVIPAAGSTGSSGSGSGGSGGSGATYTVRKGDTLTGVAIKFGVTVRALAAANSVVNVNMILVGTVLVIPGKGSSGSSPSSGGTAPKAPAGGGINGTYIVQSGDSLASISRKTGVPASTIMAANGMTKTNQLYVSAQVLLGVRNSASNPPLARCPLPGAPFGFDWGFPREGGRFHQGTDMFAPRGTPIRAAASGRVSQVVGSIGGNQVTLFGNNGTTYINSHLSRFGATGHVNAGDIIGYVGNTGSAAGGPTHLHFEVHPGNGSAVNAYGVLVAACR